MIDILTIAETRIKFSFSTDQFCLTNYDSVTNYDALTPRY